MRNGVLRRDYEGLPTGWMMWNLSENSLWIASVVEKLRVATSIGLSQSEQNMFWDRFVLWQNERGTDYAVSVR